MDPAAPEETVDPWDEVTDRIDLAVKARALVSALRELPAAERDVLLLVAWEQLTPAEAAMALSIPPGTAHSREMLWSAVVEEMVSASGARAGPAEHQADRPQPTVRPRRPDSWRQAQQRRNASPGA